MPQLCLVSVCAARQLLQLSSPVCDNNKHTIKHEGKSCTTTLREVVEHDDVSASSDSSERLFDRAALDFDFEREAADGARLVHGGGYAASALDVIVFQHDHRREIHAVCIAAANNHCILLDDSKSRRSLASASDPASPVL
jgi:hypothetical protein